jgi:hypothetical protein
MSPRHGTPIEDLRLSARAQNMLQHAGLTTVEQVLATPDEDLLRVRNFGQMQLRELKTKLCACGYLAADMPPPVAGRLEGMGGLEAWGTPAEHLLHRIHEETVRRGHRRILPVHILAALLSQPAVQRWLDTLGQAADLGAFERALDALLPVGEPVRGKVQLDDESCAVLDVIRPPTQNDTDPTLYFRLTLKRLLETCADCRSLLASSGSDVGAVEQALASLS